MKDLQHPYKDQLFDLLDGKLSPEEAAHLKTQIALSPELKTYYEEAKSIHQMLSSSTLADPSSHFTKAVMGKLNDPQTLSSPSIWKGIFLLCGMLLAVGIAAVLVSKGVFNDSTTISLNDINLPKGIAEKNLPSFSIDGKMIMHVIIGMNMIIGFIVLDRTILKPLFSKRRMTV